MKLIVRDATLGDADSVFGLVRGFATSFAPERRAFDRSLEAIIPEESASLKVAECDGEIGGYCLGFDHYAFYANGRVSWVEEIMVRTDLRRRSVGHALMSDFEAWASGRGSRLVGLATRRAAPFYKALGYEESAMFLRKLSAD
jgi:GNAT superfamily N-acetyltransferase